MNSTAVAVHLGEQAWSVSVLAGDNLEIVEFPCPEERPLDEHVKTMTAQLAERGVSPGSVVVTVPSAWCMSAAIDRVIAPRARAHDQLLALEQVLPVAIEEVTADFIAADSHISGVCMSRPRLERLTDAIESCGWTIQAVCPAALLALAWRERSSTETDTADVVLGREEKQWVLLQPGPGHFASWHLCGEDLQTVQFHIRSMMLASGQSPARLTAYVAAPEELAAIESIEGVRLLRSSTDECLALAAARAARGVLSGEQLPPVDLLHPGASRLRMDRLRRPATIGYACVMLLLLSTALSLWVRAWRMDARVGEMMQEQTELLRRVVPDLPKREVRRPLHALESELHRLGGDARSASLERRMQAIGMLYDVLRHLPAESRLRLDAIQVTSDRAELTGLVPSHEVAGQLAAALAADPDLAVEAPRTVTGRTGAVNFTLQLQRQIAAPRPGGVARGMR